ncbi:uncharacterized protein MYCGRDRAFT_94663 [Zymoseptoria tritici IPO323]|uniref:Uncharacterized protein n=1 Tax=Zymoseptoria tritici (strain CBS 115943 / IPO323) TaxID=336722 RepID=F9XGP1_ZYMTI|nr:uncharacterized protein MYCGRDRAFT_94663 [Zymoseptoria tritici IPO323]EGP85795.1 hypothetical protein MYCGRDRAFT_94663 [Zymoseptoria tritici IPO323]
MTMKRFPYSRPRKRCYLLAYKLQPPQSAQTGSSDSAWIRRKSAPGGKARADWILTAKMDQTFSQSGTRALGLRQSVQQDACRKSSTSHRAHQRTPLYLHLSTARVSTTPSASASQASRANDGGHRKSQYRLGDRANISTTTAHRILRAASPCDHHCTTSFEHPGTTIPQPD